MTPHEIARARADTPGVEKTIHFNSAGCALPTRMTVEAMAAHLRLEAEIGGYEAHERMNAEVDRPYVALAKLINASPDEIALTENATRAWDMAFYSLPLKAGDRIVTGRNEYCSNFIAFLQRARRDGVEIDVVPDTEEGEISVHRLEAMLTERTKLIALTHTPTSGGLVNPAAEVGAVARRAGIPFLLDACQSVGQMPIDVDAIGCDMLSATARKFLRGPRGVGFLYVRRNMIERLDPVCLNDHAADWIADDDFRIRSDARRFETQECNFAGRIGFGLAIDYALALSIEKIHRRITDLAVDLRLRLSATPGVSIHDRGRVQCGIVTFSVAGQTAEAIKTELARRGISVTVSYAEATRLDMVPRGLEQIVRASVHYYNSLEEVERLVEALAHIRQQAA